jgi:pilus assembly protein CpaE
MTASTSNRTFGQWKVLQVGLGDRMRRDLELLVATHLPFSTTKDLTTLPSRAEMATFVAELAPSICFVDTEFRQDECLRFISDLVAVDKNLPIVTLHAGSDSDFILKCLRNGATEFLVQPLNSEQFVAVMERISSVARGSRPNTNAKVYCVVPAKGACGASTIACSLAFMLKKLGPGRTILADLDPLAGTISFQLKLKQTFSFLDAITRPDLDEEIWKGLIYSLNSVDILLAPDRPVHGIDESHDPGALLHFARMSYENAVIDTGGVYGRWATSLLHLCDVVLLVTTNELSALQATQRSLAYLDRARVERGKVRVVVNRFNKEVGLNEEVIAAALHTEITQVIPSDYDSVQKALVDGRPLPSSGPVGRSLLQLASTLSGKEVSDAVEQKPSGFGSLFGSLLGRR